MTFKKEAYAVVGMGQGQCALAYQRPESNNQIRKNRNIPPPGFGCWYAAQATLHTNNGIEGAPWNKHQIAFEEFLFYSTLVTAGGS